MSKKKIKSVSNTITLTTEPVVLENRAHPSNKSVQATMNTNYRSTKGQRGKSQTTRGNKPVTSNQQPKASAAVEKVKNNNTSNARAVKDIVRALVQPIMLGQSNLLKPRFENMSQVIKNNERTLLSNIAPNLSKVVTSKDIANFTTRLSEIDAIDSKDYEFQNFTALSALTKSYEQFKRPNKILNYDSRTLPYIDRWSKEGNSEDNIVGLNSRSTNKFRIRSRISKYNTILLPYSVAIRNRLHQEFNISKDLLDQLFHLNKLKQLRGIHLLSAEATSFVEQVKSLSEKTLTINASLLTDLNSTISGVEDAVKNELTKQSNTLAKLIDPFERVFQVEESSLTKGIVNYKESIMIWDLIIDKVKRRLKYFETKSPYNSRSSVALLILIQEVVNLLDTAALVQNGSINNIINKYLSALDEVLVNNHNKPSSASFRALIFSSFNALTSDILNELKVTLLSRYSQIAYDKEYLNFVINRLRVGLQVLVDEIHQQYIGSYKMPDTKYLVNEIITPYFMVDIKKIYGYAIYSSLLDIQATRVQAATVLSEAMGSETSSLPYIVMVQNLGTQKVLGQDTHIYTTWINLPVHSTYMMTLLGALTNDKFAEVIVTDNSTNLREKALGWSGSEATIYPILTTPKVDMSTINTDITAPAHTDLTNLFKDNLALRDAVLLQVLTTRLAILTVGGKLASHNFGRTKWLLSTMDRLESLGLENLISLGSLVNNIVINSPINKVEVLPVRANTIIMPKLGINYVGKLNIDNTTATLMPVKVTTSTPAPDTEVPANVFYNRERDFVSQDFLRNSYKDIHEIIHVDKVTITTTKLEHGVGLTFSSESMKKNVVAFIDLEKAFPAFENDLLLLSKEIEYQTTDDANMVQAIKALYNNSSNKDKLKLRGLALDPAEFLQSITRVRSKVIKLSQMVTANSITTFTSSLPNHELNKEQLDMLQQKLNNQSILVPLMKNVEPLEVFTTDIYQPAVNIPRRNHFEVILGGTLDAISKEA